MAQLALAPARRSHASALERLNGRRHQVAANGPTNINNSNGNNIPNPADNNNNSSRNNSPAHHVNYIKNQIPAVIPPMGDAPLPVSPSGLAHDAQLK
eukprot:CAMPEP_0177646988 /NCGR_PEP_ID=MMETSP0447-20121125/10063_1 /TAXON_ID=0 /ORGANISM="Stygamoeba regulata, Strain BSH-02190019" /LENGTH=96 /DNA_ID=CAMNT_0019149549 /DNA_START=77 /DNA_END=368 /DNA_ORIENTATION=-